MHGLRVRERGSKLGLDLPQLKRVVSQLGLEPPRKRVVIKQQFCFVARRRGRSRLGRGHRLVWDHEAPPPRRGRRQRPRRATPDDDARDATRGARPSDEDQDPD